MQLFVDKTASEHNSSSLETLILANFESIDMADEKFLSSSNAEAIFSNLSTTVPVSKVLAQK